MGGSEAWFNNYERLYNEREAGEREGTDEELAELADEELRDQYADRADQINDERWIEAKAKEGKHDV